jgi:prepilin-type N-terminal cleavage/methylation domain-containing protein
VAAPTHLSDESGLSMAELLVVVAIVAITAGIAAPSLSATLRTSAYKSTVTTTVNRLATRRAEAARGSSTVFSTQSDIILEHPSMVLNPFDVQPPDLVEIATDITFQGGTGDCYVSGERRRAAIVIANWGDLRDAYAIVVGTSGRISTMRRSANGWEEFAQ